MTAHFDFAIMAVPSEINPRRMFDKAFNQGNFAVVDELVALDGVTYSATWGMPNNREGLKQLIAMFRSAFPDLCCTVEDEISEGD